MEEEVVLNTVDVGEFLLDGARSRSLLANELGRVETLQMSMVLSSSFTQGDVGGVASVNTLLSGLEELELFADGVRGDIIEADQTRQFIDAAVTVLAIDGAFVVQTGPANDDVEVFELADGRLMLRINGSNIELTVDQSENLRVETGDGGDTVTVDPGVQTGVTIDGGTGFDNITGGSGDDTLLGGFAPDHIRGGAGDDHIDGGSGLDTLHGEAGDDRLEGGDDADELYGGDGDDRLEGGDSNDRLSGGDGDDWVLGDDGNDEMFGGRGDDRLFGHEGRDDIIGGSGDDFVDGQGGADNIAGGAGEDVLRGGRGNDTVEGGGGHDLVRGGLGDDTVEGGDGDDRLFGDDGRDTITGGAHNDQIYGGVGEDYLEGQGGDDEISGGVDNDVIYGSSGDDVLDGGSGADYLEGQAGSDTIFGGHGDDVLSGGAGDDTLAGDRGADVVVTGEGADVVRARSADSVYATDRSTIDGLPAELATRDLLETPDNIVIDGPAEFVERMEADLAFLASTDQGRELLQSIAGSDGQIRIIESGNDGSYSRPVPGTGGSPWYDINSSPGSGRNQVELGLRPREASSYPVGDGASGMKVPPVVTLVHELVHADQQIHGTLEFGLSPEINLETGLPTERERSENGTNNLELDAVGLEFRPDRDRDGSPDSGVTAPEHVSENSFRDELNIEPRTEY